MSEEIKVSEEAHKLTLELLELLNFDTTHPRVMLEDIPSFDNKIQLLLNQQIQLACLNWRHRDAALQTKIAALEAEVVELRKDSVRLEWLISTSVNDDSTTTQNNGGVCLMASTRLRISQLRSAIDTALSSTKGEK